MSKLPGKTDLFKERPFEQEIIILCARWYLRYELSYRDLVEMMAEGGLPIARMTILRWIRYNAPEFDKRWSCFSTQVGTSWRVDETYVRIRGQRYYSKRLPPGLNCFVVRRFLVRAYNAVAVGSAAAL